jgi:hypothetical protein
VDESGRPPHRPRLCLALPRRFVDVTSAAVTSKK